VISSSAASSVSTCGVLPGSRWKSASGMRRAPRTLSTSTIASSAASATHMSEGFVAMHDSLTPRTPRLRLNPPIASHPLPGSRLLQAAAES
jgi:hypothetical protein